MIGLCDKVECKELPEYFCDCENVQTFHCSAHLSSHISDSQGSKHCLQAMYKIIHPQKKAYIIEQCNIVFEDLKDIETNISASFQAVINDLSEQKTELIKYFREKKKSIQHIIDKITNEDKEIVVPGYEIHDSYQTNCINFLKNLADQIAYETEILTHKTKSISKEIIEKKEIFGEFLDFTGNANLDEHLYGFKTGTKTFIEFNTLTLSVIRSDIAFEKSQGSLACLCQIPGKKLFYLGGYSPDVNSGFIIDLKTHKIEKFAKSRDRTQTHATYYNDFVYVFGGNYQNVCVNSCEKYNHTTKQWFDIAIFPEKDMRFISTLPNNNNFILSCHAGTNLYNYNIITDNYQILASTVNNSEYNALFRNLKNYYYISTNSLFTSIQGSLEFWIKFPKALSVSLPWSTGKPVTRGKFVYLMCTNSSQVFGFDLEINDLMLIASF